MWDTPLSLGETQEQRDTAEECSITTFVRQLYQTSFTGMGANAGIVSVVVQRGSAAAAAAAAAGSHSDFPGLISYNALQRVSDKKALKKIVLPSKAAIHLAWQQTSWNYRYWRDRTRYPKGMFNTNVVADATSTLKRQQQAVQRRVRRQASCHCLLACSTTPLPATSQPSST